jgi:hypothetical protein
MLTKARLLELGFKEKTSKDSSYLQKGNFCLFDMGGGSWSVGSDFGALATSNTYIINESQLEEQTNDAG